MSDAKPYQVEGIAFLAPKPRALLGDDAGLGKSFQLIRASIRAQARRLLVLCPAVGRVSWGLQFQEWDIARRPVLFHPQDTKGLTRLPPGPLAVVVTFSQLSDKARAAAFLKLLQASDPFDAAFVDEAHNLKTPGAQRTKSIYGPRMDLAKSAVLHGVPIIWATSATFCPLNAAELYPHLRALLPDTLRDLWGGSLPSAWEFTHRYCRVQDTPFGQRILGNNPATIPQLRAALGPHFLMRLKAQVLPQLPALQTELLGLDAPLPGGAREAKAAAATVAAMGDDEFLAHLARLQLQDPAYSTKRRELGLAKAEAAWPWIEDFLTNDPRRKLIVFAHHRAVLDRLHERAVDADFQPAKLDGGTPAGQAAYHVDSFQTDPRCRIFVGQTRAAGVAITLTAAQDVLLLEPDPSPLINYQAVSRAHRLGQQGSVTARLAFAEADPIDRRLAQTLRRRSSDHEQLFGAAVPGSLPSRAPAGAPLGVPA